MRPILVLLLTSVLLPALDLTVIDNFTGTEEQTLVFSYGQLYAKTTVSEVPDGFRIFDIDTNGTIELGPSASGPWTLADTVTNRDILPAHYLRYTPDSNISGTKAIFTLRAFKGADTSGLDTIFIVLAPTPDPITAASGTFAQPDAPATRVTEDTAFTFTFATIASTLAVSEPDGEPYKLVITGLASGTLTEGDNTPITVFPFELLSGESVKWTGDLHAYTKPADNLIPAEPARAAFTVRAVNTGPPADQTAVVTFSTFIDGDSDAALLAGLRTTLGSFDPIPITKGEINILTHNQLRNLAHGTNDFDRTGGVYLNLAGAGLNGCIFRLFDSAGTPIVEYTTVPQLVYVGNSRILHIVPADGMPTGSVSAGTVQMDAIGATLGTSDPPLALSFQVSPAGGGGGGESSPSGSSGSSCGAGALAGLLGCGLLPLLRRRRRS